MLCVCQGTCPSFQKMNIFEVINYFRRNEKIDFVAIHPQLCATDGDNFWKILLGGNTNEITKIIVAGCAPEMQKRLFREIFRDTGFDESRHIGVDIRNMTTEEAIKAIEEALNR
ncbi:heterodisulfide reductase subunit A-like protein [Ignisphaera aggregans DSM 17230]|uniref:Heterodisulfide reductase subunit A-like protein n=1 Tax=Ignisphaera aggregans (strain DSM 17230 / JCM 13409 / AQ1.S1) TaxID=583356 RepID=E0SPQ7_IGNAA|nr:heterodisulfide reductase subunit A-like protein [Ignisphaera aggregans DSM 17230]